jgi:hypothetical protein
MQPPIRASTPEGQRHADDGQKLASTAEVNMAEHEALSEEEKKAFLHHNDADLFWSAKLKVKRAHKHTTGCGF